MNLRESLEREVADVHADPDTLLRAVAARSGVRRRRRRVARDVGVALAVAALVVGVLAGVTDLRSSLRGAAEPPAAGPTASASTDATPGPADATVPVTGRTAAAVLLEVLADLDETGVLPGRVQPGSIGGSPEDATAGEQAFTRLELRTEAGGTELVVNVQRWSTLGLTSSCDGRTDCRAATLPDGDRLTTYRPDDGKALGQLAVELVSTRRDLRVLVSATQSADGTDLLAREQVAAVARAQQWQLELPARYAEAAADLPSYDEG